MFMALFVTNPAKRSELQEKLAAELREKAARTTATEADQPDGVEDSNYVKGYKKSSSLFWAWVVILVVAVVVAIVAAVIVS